MRYSESLTHIAEALALVQAEIKNPIKNQTNKGVQGAPKYANLEDTLQDYVRPVLSQHGMSVFQSIKTDESGRVGVCTVLLHESGEFIEGDYVFCEIKIPVNKEGKEVLTQGQATGVNITYLRRYSLNAALGINGDKDDDGSYSDTPVKNASEPASHAGAAPGNYEAALAFEITFGKHKGKTLKEIYRADRSYIDWLANGERTDPDIKQAIAIINDEIAKSKGEKQQQAKEETKPPQQEAPAQSNNGNWTPPTSGTFESIPDDDDLPF